jgi:hypothetical protein
MNGSLKNYYEPNLNQLQIARKNELFASVTAF